MCADHGNKKHSKKIGLQSWIFIAASLGLIMGFYPVPGQEKWALAFMTLFTNILKLISLPVIFLSLLTSFTGIDEIHKFQKMSYKTVKWTFLTTIIAALTSLTLYLIIQPVHSSGISSSNTPSSGIQTSFLDHLVNLFPSNIFQPFLEGNVFGILLLAIGLGIALLKAPNRDKIHDVLTPLLFAMMKLVKVILAIIPLTVWSGIILSFASLTKGKVLTGLALYLTVVVGANLLQGLIILPLILKAHGISPFSSLRIFFPALTVAFFSKSSVATMPIAMRTAENGLGIRAAVSRFVFPICTTINMNGCAAFILATGLFVSASNGFTFTGIQLIGWVFIATIAAIGNAGVPMGCYFLSTALLAAMDIPVEMMGLILPFYTLIDMVETALNVWSDASVAMIVNKETTLKEISNGSE